MCFPLPVAPGERKTFFHGLYDVLCFEPGTQRIVANDVNADHKDIVIITGANQGGKSTLLAGIG